MLVPQLPARLSARRRLCHAPVVQTPQHVKELYLAWGKSEEAARYQTFYESTFGP